MLEAVLDLWFHLDSLDKVLGDERGEELVEPRSVSMNALENLLAELAANHGGETQRLLGVLFKAVEAAANDSFHGVGQNKLFSASRQRRSLPLDANRPVFDERATHFLYEQRIPNGPRVDEAAQTLRKHRHAEAKSHQG